MIKYLIFERKYREKTLPVCERTLFKCISNAVLNVLHKYFVNIIENATRTEQGVNIFQPSNLIKVWERQRKLLAVMGLKH